MEKPEASEEKTEKPHAFFAEPYEVLVAAKLSNEQKSDILQTLEQDARQMSVASNEGMAGGELAKLSDVLEARDSLNLPPVVHAYDLVLNDLRSRLKTDLPGDARALMELAMTAVEAVCKSPILQPVADSVGAGPPGVLARALVAETDDEIAREKLDP
jgi:hypothetical protein